MSYTAPNVSLQQALVVENLVTAFSLQGRYLPAVDGCSFSLNQGKTLGLVGESGCGKSVTSLSILRLIPEPLGKILSGKILFNGQDILQLKERDLQKLRGHKISMIFQEPMTSLNPVMSLGLQVAEVFRIHKNLSKKEAKERSIHMLDKVQIPSARKRFDEYPHQISGGMRQRVMIAMALACEPEILLADEPTTALDVTIQSQILALINSLQTERNMSVLLITHDLGVVAETCDTVAVMYAGKIVEQGPTQDIFKSPLHPFTQGLLKAIPMLGMPKDRLETIPGRVPSLGKMPIGCRFQDRCLKMTKKCQESEPLLISDGDHKVACFHA